jgi:hypothetical protein
VVRAEHQDQNYAEAYIDLINTIQSTMPSNRTSNDIDLVQPTQYNVRPNWVAKNPPLEPWPLPDFVPLAIDDFDNHGTPNLPPSLDQNDLFAIFSQFFTDEVVDKLVEWMN